MDPAWALFESAARIDDDGDVVTGKARASRQQRDEHFPEKIIVSGAGLCNTSQTLLLDTWEIVTVHFWGVSFIAIIKNIFIHIGVWVWVWGGIFPLYLHMRP